MSKVLGLCLRRGEVKAFADRVLVGSGYDECQAYDLSSYTLGRAAIIAITSKSHVLCCDLWVSRWYLQALFSCAEPPTDIR